MNKKKDVEGGTQTQIGSIFLFENCRFYECSTEEEKKVNLTENKKNIVILQKKTDVYSVAKYVMHIEENVRRLIADNQVLDIPMNNNVRFFSFTSAKLQKIIIISVLEYLNEKALAADDDEDLIEKYNPLQDMELLINRDCGFSIDYNFMKLGISSIYNKELQGDTESSIFEFINSDYSKSEVIEHISRADNLSSIDRFLFSYIPDVLKQIIVNTACEFILYPAFELGSRLNNFKESDWKIDEKIKISTIYKYSKNIIANTDYITYIKTAE